MSNLNDSSIKAQLSEPIRDISVYFVRLVAIYIYIRDTNTHRMKLSILKLSSFVKTKLFKLINCHRFS